jgi:hypothetical protein
MIWNFVFRHHNAQDQYAATFPEPPHRTQVRVIGFVGTLQSTRTEPALCRAHNVARLGSAT